MNDDPETKLVTLNYRKTFLQSRSEGDLDKSIAGIGERIAILLNDPKVIEDANAVGVLDCLLGAVYCLIHAKHHDFEDRTDKQIETDVIKNRASQIQNGDVRIDGKWIAGWHFNGVLFRIAAVFHRLLKLTEGDPASREYVPSLLPKAKARYKQSTGVDWSCDRTYAIHVEVNTLKHTPQALYSARKAKFDDALESINELLSLFETWHSDCQPSSAK